LELLLLRATVVICKLRDQSIILFQLASATNDQTTETAPRLTLHHTHTPDFLPLEGAPTHFEILPMSWVVTQHFGIDLVDIPIIKITCHAIFKCRIAQTESVLDGWHSLKIPFLEVRRRILARTESHGNQGTRPVKWFDAILVGVRAKAPRDCPSRRTDATAHTLQISIAITFALGAWIGIGATTPSRCVQRVVTIGTTHNRSGEECLCRPYITLGKASAYRIKELLSSKINGILFVALEFVSYSL